MASYDQMLLASLYNGTQGHVKATAYFPIMWVRCKTRSTYPDATVAVSAGGDIAFTTDGTTADTTVSTDGTIDLSTPAVGENTLVEVKNTINVSPNWEARILGGIGSMAVDGLFYTTTEANAAGENGLILYGDSTVVQTADYYYAFAVSGFDPTSDVKGADCDAGCQSIIDYITATINFTSAGTLKIYSSSQSEDHLLETISLVDNTATPLGTRGGPPLWKSRLGERLVVLLTSDLSLTGAGGALTVQGRSMDWSTGRFVSGYVLTNAAG